jgi:hypothetical protein
MAMVPFGHQKVTFKTTSSGGNGASGDIGMWFVG